MIPICTCRSQVENIVDEVRLSKMLREQGNEGGHLPGCPLRSSTSQVVRTELCLVTYRDDASGSLWLAIAELPEIEADRRDYARRLVMKEFPDRDTYDNVHAARIGEFVDLGKRR